MSPLTGFSAKHVTERTQSTRRRYLGPAVPHPRSPLAYFSIGFGLLLLPLAACYSNVDTEFIASLSAWEENAADCPSPQDGVEYPETINMVVAERWEGAPNVHACGYVRRGFDETWEAVTDPLVGADRSPNTDTTFEFETQPEYRVSYIATLDIDDIIDTVIELTWIHDIVEGSVENPRVGATRWQKTAGTSAVSLLEASLITTRVNDEVTRVEWQYHMAAAFRGPPLIMSIIQDYYDSIVEVAHGRPLPEQD